MLLSESETDILLAKQYNLWKSYKHKLNDFILPPIDKSLHVKHNKMTVNKKGQGEKQHEL